MMTAYVLGGIVGAAVGIFLVGFLLRRFARLPAWLAAALATAWGLGGALVHAFVHRPSAIAQRISGGKEAHLSLTLSVARFVIGGVIAYWFLQGVKPRERKPPSMDNVVAQ
jgi:hypothetical protein